MKQISNPAEKFSTDFIRIYGYGYRKGQQDSNNKSSALKSP